MAGVGQAYHEFYNVVEKVDVRPVSPCQRNVNVVPVHHVDSLD